MPTVSGRVVYDIPRKFCLEASEKAPWHDCAVSVEVGAAAMAVREDARQRLQRRRINRAKRDCY